jgi:hypothetical protein
VDKGSAKHALVWSCQELTDWPTARVAMDAAREVKTAATGGLRSGETEGAV